MTDSDAMPGGIRFTRIFVWIQATLTITFSLVQVGTILRVSSLSNSELRELGLQSHEQIGYGAIWTQAIVLFLAGAVLAIAALRVPSRSRRVRALAIAAEVPIVLLAGLNLPALNWVVLLGLFGVISFILMLRVDARDWFDA